MFCFEAVQCVNLVGVIRKTSPCFAWLRRRKEERARDAARSAAPGKSLLFFHML